MAGPAVEYWQAVQWQGQQSSIGKQFSAKATSRVLASSSVAGPAVEYCQAVQWQGLQWSIGKQFSGSSCSIFSRPNIDLKLCYTTQGSEYTSDPKILWRTLFEALHDIY